FTFLVEQIIIACKFMQLSTDMLSKESCLRISLHDPGKQSTDEILAQVGEDVKIYCSLKKVSDASYLYWYRKASRNVLVYILRSFGGKDKNNPDFPNRFYSTVDKTSEEFELSIDTVLMTDSAVYYCAKEPTLLPCYGGSVQKLQLEIIPCSGLSGLTKGDSVTQKVTLVTGKEGGSVTMECHYDTSLSDYYLHWYREQQETQPHYALKKGSVCDKYKADFAEKRFSVELQTSTKFSSLTISLLELSDSAVYYCRLVQKLTAISGFVLLSFLAAAAISCGKGDEKKTQREHNINSNSDCNTNN
uniref:Ig-like domain-containing protein n=1 Tax=Callorhinchus milii TaxID=7868 RepID=A0A4W3GCR9_CALMI